MSSVLIVNHWVFFNMYQSFLAIRFKIFGVDKILIFDLYSAYTNAPKTVYVACEIRKNF